jgi:predicted DCC family thiol-disulfide oxidoreductase YuxK
MEIRHEDERDRLSRLPLISQLLDIGYSVFAQNRVRLTGRCTAATCPSQAEGGGAATVNKSL